MADRQRLFVDMDGTLAVFKPVDEIETLYERGYFLNLIPMEKVVQAVKDIISNSPNIEVDILSAYLTDSEYALAEKNEWLNKHLPQIDSEHRIFVPCGQDKINYIPHGIRPNDYLLDDYTHNLTLWEPPAKGIKLLNGINHTQGTWKNDRLRYDKQPKELATNIVSIMQGRDRILDTIPVKEERGIKVEKKDLKRVADFIVADGTMNTSEGNWIMSYDELSKKFEVDSSLYPELVELLEQHEEVADAVINEDGIDVNYYLDYCPNYNNQEERSLDMTEQNSFYAKIDYLGRSKNGDTIVGETVYYTDKDKYEKDVNENIDDGSPFVNNILTKEEYEKVQQDTIQSLLDNKDIGAELRNEYNKFPEPLKTNYEFVGQHYDLLNLKQELNKYRNTPAEQLQLELEHNHISAEKRLSMIISEIKGAEDKISNIYQEYGFDPQKMTQIISTTDIKKTIHKQNIDCLNFIEKNSRENYNGYTYPADYIAEKVKEQYGTERPMAVLAQTIQRKSEDGRISPSVRERASQFTNETNDTGLVTDHIHSGLLNELYKGFMRSELKEQAAQKPPVIGKSR